MSFEGPHVGWKQDHTFDWNSMQPDGGGPPTGAIADRIKDSFGDYAGFHQAFVDAAVTQFGSGWAWLVRDQDKKLEVVKTANAETPMGARNKLSPDLRRVGARLLPRLSEPPPRLRQRLARHAGKLAIRIATARRRT